MPSASGGSGPMSWKACEPAWRRGWLCTISVSGSTSNLVVLGWLSLICWSGDLNSHQAFKALLLCITAGLIWQFVLTLILARREQGTLRWSRVRDALWLLSPRDPRSGRVGGRVWLWVIPFVLLYGLWSFFGFVITGPSNRDLV